MKYAVISDLHANLSALRRVLADASAMGAERVACLGDVVGYGPLPAETVALVRRSASVVVAGNHDDAVSGRIDSSDFTDLAGDSVERHRAQLSKEDVSWLRSLPYAARLDGALAVHGDFADPESFNYVDSEDAAAENFARTDAQIVFVGHTHTPCIYVTGGSGRIYRLDPQDFVAEDGKRYIVNPGSVGYPRATDGTCFSTYVIYDSATRTVKFRSIPFAVASVMQRGRLRHSSIIMKIAIATAVFAAAAAAYFAMQNGGPSTAPAEIQLSDAGSTLVVAEKSLDLPPSAKTVRANLQLSGKSTPAQVETTFLDAAGKTLSQESKQVKKSYTKAISVPSGAASVRFRVMKTEETGAPAITAFDPKL